MRLAHWLLLTSIFCLVGCGSFGGPPAHAYQERCPYQPSWRNDPAHKTRPTPGNPVFTLKLTSQGEWVDRCDYADLLQELQADLDPLKIVLYVHGWKHGPVSDDHKYFSEFIKKVAAAEDVKIGEMPAKAGRVIGVYVGWPGNTIEWPALKELTYWGRQKASDRISQSGIVAKIIAGVASVRGSIPNIDGRSVSVKDQLILIGHSFGARILLTATSQLLIQEVESAHPGTRQPTISGPPTDPQSIMGWPYRCIPSKRLIVLLNPAVEAFTFSFFYNTRRSDHEFRKGQQPLILAISTVNDKATKTAFPIGQAIGLNWHEKELVTIGNYFPFQTHSLTRAGNCKAGSAWYDSFQTVDGICLERLGGENAAAEKLKDPDVAGEMPKHFRMGIERHSNQSGNPFIVAQTTAEIIDGHNGIWKNEFTNWLISFIKRREANNELC